MVRGRRNAKRLTAETRRAQAAEDAERAELEAAQRAADEVRKAARMRTDRIALDRLSALSRELHRLHREEAKLLRERDGLVARLRESGHSWNVLSARTHLSRQALMKRSSLASESIRRGVPTPGPSADKS